MTLNEIKKRYAGIQNYMEQIGSGGCLFYTLCTIIEEVTGKPADLIAIVQKSIAKGWLSKDFTVNDSLRLLGEFTGKTWKRTVVSKLPAQIKDNEFTIEKWYNPTTKYEHFKRRFVDTLLASVTVKEGYIKEYYIYYYKVA